MAASLKSWLGARKRRDLFDRQEGLNTIRDLSWKEFELLVAEAYRRIGYQVSETGQGGPDGGIDLKLERSGDVVLVQCKCWRSWKIGVCVVREMYGLLKHHQADEVKIVCVGTFTAEAEAFARGKEIELVDGAALEQLLAGIRLVDKQVHALTRVEPTLGAASRPDAEPKCPRCEHAMTRRRNRSAGNEFWGCERYPDCRGTRSI